MRDTVGAENTLAFEPSMTAEDFSYFLLEKPGAYFVIGNGDGRHRLAYSRKAPATPTTRQLARPTTWARARCTTRTTTSTTT